MAMSRITTGFGGHGRASMPMRSIKAWFVLVLGAVLVSTSAAAASQDEAMARIERMVTAARTLNYDATFVYSHGSQMDEMRIIHRFRDGAERERLVTLSGSTREVLRDDSRVTCIIPDSQSVVVGKSRPQSLYGSPLLTAEGYDEHYLLAVSYTHLTLPTTHDV